MVDRTTKGQHLQCIVLEKCQVMLIQSEANPLQEDACGCTDANHYESEQEADPHIKVFNAHDVSGDIDEQAEDDYWDHCCLTLKSPRIPALSKFLEKIPLKHEVDTYQVKQYGEGQRQR